MKKRLICNFVIFFLILCIDLNSNSNLPEVISSTFLTQDLSKSNADVEIITHEDIEALGINNIPDLLDIAAGVNIYHVNESTANFSIRGYPVDLRIAPLILIDGMEISENFYDRTYLYNLPVEISDIDRIEIIKNPTYTLNGNSNIAGIINIVTKSPEYLDENYIYQEIGSKFYKKTFFSLNKFFWNSYVKINGYFKRIDQNDTDYKSKDSYFLSSQIVKYFSNSKLNFKFSFMNNDLDFKESVVTGLIYRPLILSFYNHLNNFKYFNFLVNYKIKNFDISLYHQSAYGDVLMDLPEASNSIFSNSRFTKFSIRKKINIKKNKILIGSEARLKYGYLAKSDSMKRESINFFIQDNYNIFKYFYFNIFFKNDRTKDLGNKISYKLNLLYKKPGFILRLGYSREFKKPFMIYQYQNLSLHADSKTLPILKEYNLNEINLYYHKNRMLSSYQIKSTEFSLTKKINNINFDFTYFYNLIYDIPNIVGNINFFPFQIDINTENLMDFCVYGFDSKVEYDYKDYKLFLSYYNQNIKNKTYNSKKNSFIPKYKVSGGVLIKGKKLKGSVSFKYLPAIKKYDYRTDYYLSVNSSITISFFRDKLKATIYGNNIFNNRFREDISGDKIQRNIFFRVRYDF